MCTSQYGLLIKKEYIFTNGLIVINIFSANYALLNNDVLKLAMFVLWSSEKHIDYNDKRSRAVCKGIRMKKNF